MSVVLVYSSFTVYYILLWPPTWKEEVNSMPPNYLRKFFLQILEQCYGYASSLLQSANLSWWLLVPHHISCAHCTERHQWLYSLHIHCLLERTGCNFQRCTFGRRSWKQAGHGCTLPIQPKCIQLLQELAFFSAAGIG